MSRAPLWLLSVLSLSGGFGAACKGDKDTSDTDDTDVQDTSDGLDPDDPCDPWVSDNPLDGMASLDGVGAEALRAQLEAEATSDGLCRWVDAICRGEDGFAYTVFIQGETVGGLAVFYDSFGTLIAVADYSTEACPGGFDTITTWYGDRLSGCSLETLGDAVGPCTRRCDQVDTEAGDTDGCDETVATGAPVTGGRNVVYATGALGPSGAARLVQGAGNAARVQVVAADGSMATLSGEALSGFGSSVAVGDVTGDSQDDLVVGAPGARLGSGAVYVFAGPISGDLGVADAWTTLRGGANDGLGKAVVVGDFESGRASASVGALGRETVWVWRPDPIPPIRRTVVATLPDVVSLLSLRRGGDAVDTLVVQGPELATMWRFAVASPPVDTDTDTDTDSDTDPLAPVDHVEVDATSSLVLPEVAVLMVHPDADGLPGEDLLVGDPAHGDSAGRVWMVPGTALSGTERALSDVAVATVSGSRATSSHPTSTGDLAGAGVLVADVDDDGSVELLIAAPGEDAPFAADTTACLDAARAEPVYVAAGQVHRVATPLSGDTALSGAPVVLAGALDNMGTGALLGAVDVDGDGQLEVRASSLGGVGGDAADVLADVCLP